MYPSVKLPFHKVCLTGGPDSESDALAGFTHSLLSDRKVSYPGSLFYLQYVSCLHRGTMTAMLISDLETMKEIIPLDISKQQQYHHCLSFNQMWL